MSRIELLGINGDELTEQQSEVIASCCSVVASKRHAPLVSPFDIPVIPIAPITGMVEKVQKCLTDGSVAILASGDPLFYGIGKTLLNYFNAEQIEIHPALSSVQLACTRFKTSWDDMVLISLHGRAAENISGKILPHAKTLLFTDNVNTPKKIAQNLLAALTASGDSDRINNIRMRVAEDLALKSEKIHDGTLEELSSLNFSPLNMVFIEQTRPQIEQNQFGLTEKEIHHSRGLITKDEVRAVSLHKLHLPKQGVLWDIGGGSGSVSLEAARMNPELRVYTIEKKAEEQQNIRDNIKKYNTYNMSLVCGEAPEALSELPPPDRIFIGGSGGNMETIIALATDKLPVQGRIVANAVLAKTAKSTPVFMKDNGLQVQTSTLKVTRQETGQEEATHFNPITIITGIK